MELGVGQGDVISPLLFSIFFNGLIRALKAKGVGVHMVNRILCGLWYADDTCLLAGKSTELRVAMSCVDEFFHKWRLEANANKSGVMIVRGSGHYAMPEEERPYIFWVVRRSLLWRYVNIWALCLMTGGIGVTMSIMYIRR